MLNLIEPISTEFVNLKKFILKNSAKNYIVQNAWLLFLVSLEIALIISYIIQFLNDKKGILRI